MAQLTKFQMVGFSHWKGLTKDNHLGAIFQKMPEKATNFMIKLLAFDRGKSLESYLAQFPVKEFESDNEYTWDVIASSSRNIPILEARDEDGVVLTTGMAGVGVSPFYVVFPEDWFADGNVIVGEKNEMYILRVLGNARMEGSNAVYKVELMGANTSGIPVEELKAGKKFSVEYSPVESTMSRGVGDVRYSSPISMRNEWSQIRIKHTVPGNSLGRKLYVGLPYKKSNGEKGVATTWMHHVEWTVEQTFSEEKNNLIMYGRSNRNMNGEYLNVGKSGNVIKMGAGLREQMEVSNVMYYNHFALKLIEDALYQLSAGKLDYNQRLFILRTGEYGAMQFHKSVLNVVSGWSQFILDNSSVGVVEKTQSKLHTNALSAGFQFTEFKAPNGVRVKIEVDPLYDNPVRNKIIHPKGGVAESYRYDILDIGSTEQPNIQLCRVKNQPEFRGFQSGIRNPFTGQIDNNYMSHDEDSATVHRMWQGGVFILDPTRTVSIIPSILR